MPGPTIAESVARVTGRIAEACNRAGRDPGSVRLVAVSKRVPLPLVVEACKAGLWDLGENRVADALDRMDAIEVPLRAAGLDPSLIRWHFIGHLQRNKAAKASGRFSLLHGVDSLDLATRLAVRARTDNRLEPILLEVNISGEAQKHGLDPAEAVGMVLRMSEISGLDIQGFMGMARYGASPAELRAAFSSLAEIAAGARSASGLPLPELSMGMSGDFEAAIAAGATIVRIGTSIFGARQDH